MKINTKILKHPSIISSFLGGGILFNAMAVLSGAESKYTLLSIALIGGIFGIYVAYKSQVDNIKQ
jgi:hypothetical protein